MKISASKGVKYSRGEFIKMMTFVEGMNKVRNWSCIQDKRFSENLNLQRGQKSRGEFFKMKLLDRVLRKLEIVLEFKRRGLVKIPICKGVK